MKSRLLIHLILDLLLIILFFGCSKNTSYVLSEKEKVANEVLKKASRTIHEKTGLSPCGNGGQMMHEIRMLNLGFQYQKPIDIEKGRELLMNSAYEFLSIINSDPKIRLYLANFPFEPKNIEIEIFLFPSDESHLSNPLEVISLNRGILKYKTNNPNSPLLQVVFQETYEEALAKLAKAP